MKVLCFVVAFSHWLMISAFAQSGALSLKEQYLANLFDPSLPFDTTSVATEDGERRAADSIQAWKQWKTVENHSFGKNRGGLPMIADLEALHPYFRDKVEELIRVCKAMGIDLAIVESYRTHAKQAEYYNMGRKYTSSPGGKSRHQYGMAVDVVPIVDSVAVWNNHRLWRKIGTAGERLGLRWGGRWRVLYDPGHFEWSGGLTRQQLARGFVPRIPAAMANRYPHLEEDLEKLRMYWEAWEAEQRALASREVPGNEALKSAVGAGN